MKAGSVRTSAWSWVARVAWVLLPISVGGALADAIAGWSTAPARVAAVLTWAAWTLGLVALLSPRPWGLTALRVLAPSAVAVAVAAFPSTSAGSAALAVCSSAVACGLALSAPIAIAASNSIAYGDERRFPLRIPASLFAGPLPLAVALVAVGTVAGPLLLADGHYLTGVPVTAVGFALAFVSVRSLHGLSRRWLVLVPAGLVIVDPLTLLDPVLMRREHIARFGRTDAGAPPDDRFDLRLGAAAGSVVIELVEPQWFARRRGRRDADVREEAVVLVATAQPDALVELAGERRIATA